MVDAVWGIWFVFVFGVGLRLWVFWAWLGGCGGF